MRRAHAAGKWRLPVLAVLLALTSGGAATAQTLKVLTVNVWSGLDYKGSLRMGEYESRETRDRRTASLVEELRRLAPDVIALQEANKLPRYARRQARELGYRMVYHVGLGGLRAGPLGLPVNLREGDVILARPGLFLRGAGRRQLSGGPVGNFFTVHFADATQVVAARIIVSGLDVYLFNTHWHASPPPSAEYLKRLLERYHAGQIDAARYEELRAQALDGQDWRLMEARKTVEMVNRVAGEAPAILLGDFNAEVGSPEIGVLLEAGFTDVYGASGPPPGYTWDGTVNSNIGLQRRIHPEDAGEEPQRRRIDLIFIRGKPLTAQGARVFLDRAMEGLYASDHFGVLAEIGLGGP